MNQTITVTKAALVRLLDVQVLIALLTALCLYVPSSAVFAYQVYGAIGEKWKELGAESGRLGAPGTDELDAAYGGRFNHFQYGSIYWHPETGAHVVWGLIGTRWIELGREQFGYPITDELPTPDGRGRYNHFRAVHVPGKPEASIYWTPETGAHEIYGAIREKWAQIGWEKSFLGYPTTGEFQDGAYRRSNFQHGYIQWSLQSGAEVLSDALRPYGLIGAAWGAMGGEKGPLGHPLTPEMDIPGGGTGRIQTFDYGQIAWSPNTGPRSVQVAYQAGDAIEFFWVATEPFNYDFWIVRTDTGGTNIDQKDVKGRRTDGWFVFRNALPGQTYSFIVEGCDEGDIEGRVAKCRQGWMNRVAVTVKHSPNKTAPTLPDPPTRGKSCWIDLGCVTRTVKEGADTIKSVVDAVKSVK